jgi:PAS domain S-box-containing protein
MNLSINKSLLLGRKALFYAVLCIAFFAWVFPLQTGAQTADLPQGAYPKAPYKVLILSERTTTPGGELNPWSHAFRQELSRELSAQPAIVLEELDIPAGVRTSPEEMERLSGMLRAMIQARNYDLVAGILDTPCHLLAQIVDSLPQELSLVFCGYEDWSSRLKEKHSNTVAMTVKYMPAETVELGLKMLPETREILFISSDDSGSAALENLVGPQTPFKECKISVLQSGGKTRQDILQAITQLPAQSFVVLGALNVSDKAALGTDETLIRAMAAQEAPKPCFATTLMPIHFGAVGGYGVGAKEFAKETSDLIKTVMSKSASSVPAINLIPIPTVDISTALKFNLETDSLPPGTKKLFEPLPAWNPSTRTLILALSLSVISLASLVGMIFFYRRHRRFTRRTMAIFNELPVRVSVVDRENRLLFCQMERGLRSPSSSGTPKLCDFKELDPEHVKNTVAWVLQTRDQTTIRYEEEGRKRIISCSPLEKNVFGTDAIVAVSQDVNEIEKERSRAEKLAEQHRIILEAIDDGLIMTDIEGNIILMNPLACRLTGFKRSEAMGKKLEEILNLVDHRTGDPFPSPVAKAIHDKREYSQNEEAILISREHTRYHIAHGAFPVGDSNGKFAGVVIVFRDITQEYERKNQAISALQNFKHAAKLASLSSFIYDLKTHKRTVESDGSKNWGYENGEPLAPDKWIVPEDLPKFREGWNQLILGQIKEFRVSYRSNYTGSLRYYTMLASVYQPEDQKEKQIFGVIQDLTHIEESERKLHDASRLFDTIMDRLPCYVYARDIDDDFRYIVDNQHIRNFFMELGADIKGKTIYDLQDTLAQNELYQVNLDTVIEGRATERTGLVTDKQGEEHILRILETQIEQSDGRRLLLGVAVDVTELKDIQKKEIESRELLQLILDYLPACVSAKDVGDDFRYIIWNKEYERHTGVSAKEVRGKTDFEINAYPGFAEDFRRLDEEVLKFGKPMHFVIDCVSARGEKLTYNSYKMPMRNREGRQLLVELNLDISREKKLERDRTEMIKRLSDLVESGDIVNECLRHITLEEDFEKVVADMLGIVGENGNADRCYVYAFQEEDQQARCIFEWTRTNIDSLPDQSLNRDQIASWSHLLENKEEVVIRDASNPPENLSETLPLLRQRDVKSMMLNGIWLEDKLWGFIGLDFVTRARDLNENDLRTIHNAVNLFQMAYERNRRKNALAEGSFRQKQIFDNIAIPIALFDTHCRVIIANPSYRTLMSEEGSDSVCRQYMSNLCRDGIQLGCNPPRSMVEAQGTYQVELVRYSNREFVVNLQPIFDRQDRLALVLETAIDVTDINEGKRRLETAMKAAQAADRAKSYFLATMSHELRTPLNAVIGFSELLQTSVLTSDQQKDYIQSINVAGNALLSLINDVLDLSKIEADQTKITPKKTTLIKLLDEIETIFKNKAQSKDLKLTIDCPENLPLLYLDTPSLRQVMLNLTGNAIKFTNVGSVSLHVRFTEFDERFGALTLAMTDTGIGVKPEYQEKIFEPFVQQDTVRGGRIYEGTGLGLSISRRLIEKMGGELTLESQEGRGSVFTVRLPIVQYEKNSPEPPAIPVFPAPLPVTLSPAVTEGCQILLVDDVKMNVQVLSAALKRLGVSSKAVSSGREALNAMETYTPNLVMTDIWMPGMDGTQLAKSIRQDRRWQSVKIVAVTADTEIDSSFDITCFDDVLLKPLTLEKISGVLHKLQLTNKERRKEEQ